MSLFLKRGALRSLSALRYTRNIRTFCSSSDNADLGPRDSMEYDVVVVGAGPAGLSAAIRVKQLALEQDVEMSVCVVEKGAEVGSHIISGNVFDPRALNDLIPDWKDKGAPIDTKVTKDKAYLTTKSSQIPLPIPPYLHNDGNYIISLGMLTRWLGEQAEELEVEIFPGFAASEVLYENEKVVGIATGDMGLDKDRKPTENFERGMELRAKQTVFAEGCRGSLSELVMDKYDLRKGKDPQIYGIGLKEIWEVDDSKFESGLVQHTTGWPSDSKTYAGSFMYHMEPNHILLGYIVGLSYQNPFLNPYQEFQQFKTHPLISNVIKGGKCLSYGARAVNEGGYNSLPRLSFPGGVLVGCSAGMLNVARIKGSHNAIKSGMLAGENIFESIKENPEEYGAEIEKYQSDMENSWVFKELKEVRNIAAAYKYGAVAGLVYSGFEGFLNKGRLPYTLHVSSSDDKRTAKRSDPKAKPKEYPKPDGELTFDLLTNLQRSGTYHEDAEPSHLRIKPEKAEIPKSVSFQEFAAPETRFCPAKVYEFTDEDPPKLVINSQNCLHCKCCSIKCPENYINWTVPQGGGGPKYEMM